MNRLLALVLFPAVLIFSSCSTFKIVDSNFEANGKKIAVVSGLNKTENLLYAELLTESIKKHSTFRVISQDEVKSRLQNYPTRIKGPYLAYMGLDAKFEKTNMDQIKKLQKQLGVDFIYVIWIPTRYTMNGSISNFCTVGQIFASPDCREIARSEYEISWSLPGALAFGFPKSPEEALTKMSDLSAIDIAEKMKVKRGEPGKKNKKGGR